MPTEQREIESYGEGYAYRMGPGLRIQHIVFAICVLVLALTGLGLLFHDTAFGRWLVEVEGGFDRRGIIHRLAAVGLILITLIHILNSLLTRTGRSDLRRRQIVKDDLAAFRNSIQSAFKTTEAGSNYGKYSFGQKVHFWLAGFMTITMIISGLILWNATAAMDFLPRWAIHVILVVHGYEGLLLFVAVVLWHLYDIHLSPRNFPMSKVWLTGRMPLDEAKKYHPLEYERIKGLAEKNEE